MSRPVDVLAVLDHAIEGYRTRAESISGLAWLHQKAGDDMAEARAAVAELIIELRNAHEIIKLAMNHVPAAARTPWFLAIDDAGLCGDGVTRFHERKAALANIGSAS